MSSCTKPQKSAEVTDFQMHKHRYIYKLYLTPKAL